MSDVQQPAVAVGAHKCKDEGKGWTGSPVSGGLKHLGADKTSKERTISPSGTSVYFVDTLEGIHNLIEALSQSPAAPPSIYLDLEGVNLGREGRISILQIYICSRDEVFLVDIHTLGTKAFDHATPDGTTLRSTLESPSIPKVLFDVRNDSAALFHQYHVELAGVHNLQVMELGTRSHPGKFLTGLGKCISWDVLMTAAEKARFSATKELGKALFSPQHGGSYEVFNVRPLSEDVYRYCVQDVLFLPRLWQTYDRALTPALRETVEVEVKNRIILSQSPQFSGKGSHMTLAPHLWEAVPECPSSWL